MADHASDCTANNPHANIRFMSAGGPPPKAQGNLNDTPFAHVLVYVLTHRLSGTLVIWPPAEAADGPDTAPREDRIRFHEGFIERARLRTPASSPALGLLPLFTRTGAPYAFYEADLVGQTPDVVTGRVDPLTLVAASLRGAAREDVIEGVLGRLGQRSLRLKRGVDLGRFQLDDREKGFVEVLQASPASAAELQAGFADPRLARRVLYLLAISRSLEPFDGGTGRTDARTSAPPTPARGSVAPAPQSLPPARSERPRKRSGSEPEPVPPPPADLAPELSQRWQQIAHQATVIDEQNYFEMLGVETETTAGEVQQAYVKLAKQWHPDRLAPELSMLRPHLDRIFHHLTEAKDVLTDAERREDYLRSVQSGGGTPSTDRKVAAIVTAAMEFQKVDVLVRRRQYKEALQLAKEVQTLNPDDVDALATEGWILALMHSDADAPFDKIHRVIDAALEIQPKSERANLYKAKVLKRQGKSDEAVDYFRRVAETNPKNTEAMREIRLATIRASQEPRSSESGGGLLNRLFGGKKAP